MRWFAVVVIVVAGCGAKPPPETGPAESVPHAGGLERDGKTSRRARIKPVEARRPDIDISAFVPDFHDELRWPLSAMAHPSLEPRFPIERELANGVDWQTLCQRGVHKRVSATQRELLAYLHAWCDVLKRDVDGACERLVPLLGSTRLGLTAAVRHDLANILVDSGNADTAEHYLSKHDIRDIQVLDLLAASYAELGKAGAASEINHRAIDSDDAATDSTRCRRLAKQIVFAGAAKPRYALRELETLATRPKLADPLCTRVHHKIMCWNNPGQACFMYLTDEKISARASHLIEAYYRWPDKASAFEWWQIADIAMRALPLPGAADLVITANEAALQATVTCTRQRAASILRIRELIRKDPDHEIYEPRLKKLRAACPYPDLDALPVSSGSAPVRGSKRPVPVGTWPPAPVAPER